MRWAALLLAALLLVAGSAETQPTGTAPAFPHANGENCPAGSVAAGVDEEGNAESCMVVSAVPGDLEDLEIGGRLHLSEAPFPITTFAEGAVGDDAIEITSTAHGLTATTYAHTKFTDAGSGFVNVYTATLPASGDEIIIEGTTSYDAQYTVNSMTGTISAYIDQFGTPNMVQITSSNTLINGDSITIVDPGDSRWDGTYAISSRTSTTFEIESPMYDNVSGGVWTSEDAYKITAAWSGTATGTWTYGIVLELYGSTNYNSISIAFNFATDTFSLVENWVNDNVPHTATWLRVHRFRAGDATPDVSIGIVYQTSENDDTITDFDWEGAQPTSTRQLIVVHSISKTNFDCTAGTLYCGSKIINTADGDVTVWVSFREETGNAYADWYLFAFMNASQDYGDDFVSTIGARFLQNTYIQNLRLTGILDFGDTVYFPKDDTTPDLVVNPGRFYTLYHAWECNDLYDAHCVDLYDNELGGPCNSDVQCSCTSGSPPCADTLCDYDGLSLTSYIPQRVDAGTAPDGYCDADGATGAPSGDGSEVTITDFDNGEDGQVIIVLNATGQELEFCCKGATSLCPVSSLECGEHKIPAEISIRYSTSMWQYMESTDTWNILAFEDFSDVDKVGLRDDQTISGEKIFDNLLDMEGGQFDLGSWTQIGTDTTPSVADTNLLHANDTVVLTDFDDGRVGQVVALYTTAVTVTIDCTGAGFSCGLVDIPLEIQSAAMFVYDGTKWRMLGVPIRGLGSNHLANYALLASPTLTGDPKAPDQSPNDNDDSIANTEYVDTADALLAPLASPTLTGDPQAPDQSAGDNDDSIANTQYVDTAIAAESHLGSDLTSSTNVILTDDAGGEIEFRRTDRPGGSEENLILDLHNAAGNNAKIYSDTGVSELEIDGMQVTITSFLAARKFRVTASGCNSQLTAAELNKYLIRTCATDTVLKLPADADMKDGSWFCVVDASPTGTFKFRIQATSSGQFHFHGLDLADGDDLISMDGCTDVYDTAAVPPVQDSCAGGDPCPDGKCDEDEDIPATEDGYSSICGINDSNDDIWIYSHEGTWYDFLDVGT